MPAERVNISIEKTSPNRTITRDSQSETCYSEASTRLYSLIYLITKSSLSFIKYMPGANCNSTVLEVEFNTPR